jgi:choline dehydrogenase-like flavoprotein
MLREMSDLESGAVITTDVAIIGGGPAGITVARQLSGSKLRVLLLESGGTDYDEKTQNLYKGYISGEAYYPLEMARLRYFGGTSNHWGGHCRPLDAIDFEKRSWVPHSGWPITRADLQPYYDRAQTVCELGPCLYADGDWPDVIPSLVDVDRKKLENRLWQYSPPTRFGDRYLPELREAGNVTVLFNANVTDIVLRGDANAVESLVVKDLGGKTIVVKPRAVVLATGGIENARLLLASRGVAPAGVGNQNGLVGRYFMEHASAIIGFGVPVDTFDHQRFKVYYDSMSSGGTIIRAAIGVTEPVQRRKKMLNGCINIGYGYDRSDGYMALRRAKQALKGEGEDGLGSAVLDVLGDLGGATAGLYRTLRNEQMFWFGPEFEQAPDPESRVKLAMDKDALGMPRVSLDWRVSEQSKRSIREAMLIVGAEMSRLGLARVRVDDAVMDDGATWEDMHGRYHHMGTTRMSADPKQGVVDANCKVHGVANLYVAGSSVFATSGYANPTLTIVALSVRLGDHLKTVV